MIFPVISDLTFFPPSFLPSQRGLLRVSGARFAFRQKTTSQYSKTPLEMWSLTILLKQHAAVLLTRLQFYLEMGNCEAPPSQLKHPGLFSSFGEF